MWPEWGHTFLLWLNVASKRPWPVLTLLLLDTWPWPYIVICSYCTLLVCVLLSIRLKWSSSFLMEFSNTRPCPDELCTHVFCVYFYVILWYIWLEFRLLEIFGVEKIDHPHFWMRQFEARSIVKYSPERYMLPEEIVIWLISIHFYLLTNVWWRKTS